MASPWKGYRQASSVCQFEFSSIRYTQIVVTPTPTLMPLLITEVFPKPSQGEEWVELYNPNAAAVALNNWELWDELSQPSLIFSFTTQTIGSNQWLVVPINKKLNDTEDGVTLKTSAGIVSDSMHYSGSETDKSLSRLDLTSNSSWNLGATSPGASNPAPTPSPTQTPTPTPQPTSTPTPDPISTITPTKTPTPSPMQSPASITNSATAPTQKLPNQPRAALIALSNLTTPPQPTALPAPTSSPTLIPTLSLEKPAPVPQNTTDKPTTLPPFYFIGLLLIQLSAVSMSLTKQGMIKPDAVAPIP